MTTLHERGQAHFLERRNRLESIDVPEWGGKVYYRPAMSARERAAIWQHYNAATGQWDQYGAILEAVLVRALTEDGRRLFAEAARNELLDRYDPEVLERIAMQMGSFSAFDDDEKKSI